MESVASMDGVDKEHMSDSFGTSYMVQKAEVVLGHVGPGNGKAWISTIGGSTSRRT